ncbi:MAG: hypothetical protein H0V29_08425 [Thermoleophilaceae bacterium]|nr:hypothetical protein [Thermoleophilaceae bacterium]
MPLRLVLLGLLAALALAGCGGDDDGDGGGEPEAIAVTEVDFEITPKDPAITEPGEFTFQVENGGETEHALEVEGKGGTDPTPPGETAELKVELDEGTYTWFCPLADHRQRGMEGVVEVGSVSASPEEDSGEGGGASGGASGY